MPRCKPQTDPEPELLLTWYRSHRRSLPWRQDRDPYRVLVSEFMLQQTRTEVVAERFDEFLRRFPTLEALAGADQEEVVAAWSGLGYYRRARALHAAAGTLQRRGAWPRTATELEDLPGVGPYTAAAVASIAFDDPVVVVDGNVKRLAARLTAEAGDPSRRQVLERLRRAAQEWLDPQHPGDGNQALMELGATVCKPRPRCESCPLTAACVAYQEGDPTAYPVRKAATPTVNLSWQMALVRRDGKLWAVRRADHERWLPGIFELPWVEARGDCASAPDAALEAKYGVPLRLDAPLAEVRHMIGRRSIRAQVWSARLDTASSGQVAGGDGRWVSTEELDSLPTSSLLHKAVAAACACRRPA